MNKRLDPEEKERRRQARQLDSELNGRDWNRHKRPIDGRKYGGTLKVKQALKRFRKLATTACPKCGCSVADDIILLRQTFYECRQCGKLFIKEGMIDPFDLDGLEE